MKHLLLAGAGLLALAGCNRGGTSTVVTANSTDSIPAATATAAGSTDTSPVSTPDAAPTDAPVTTQPDASGETTDGNVPVMR